MNYASFINSLKCFIIGLMFGMFFDTMVRVCLTLAALFGIYWLIHRMTNGGVTRTLQAAAFAWQARRQPRQYERG